MNLPKVDKVLTGIEELDRILGGGLPRGSITLLAGGPGTGKTITALQFLYNGALKFSEKGVLVIFNENASALKQYMNSMGWDLSRLENEGLIKILDFITVEKIGLESLMDMIFDEASSFMPKRLVIDSLTALIMAMEKKEEVRAVLSIIQRLLRRLECTSIVITETPWGIESLGSGVEEFVVDGIIKMELVPSKGELKRRLAVLKMRGSAHDTKYYQYYIVPNDGLVITPYPEVF